MLTLKIISTIVLCVLFPICFGHFAAAYEMEDDFIEDEDFGPRFYEAELMKEVN